MIADCNRTGRDAICLLLRTHGYRRMFPSGVGSNDSWKDRFAEFADIVVPHASSYSTSRSERLLFCRKPTLVNRRDVPRPAVPTG